MESEQENYQSQSLIQWIAPAFRHARRPLSWYLIMGGIILIFILYGLYTQSYLTSITFIIFAAVYYWLQKIEPKMVNVLITDVGIKFGKNFFTYNSIKDFWILFDPGKVHCLNLNLNKKLMSSVSIDFPPDMPPALIRDQLSKYIPEIKDKEEPLIDNLIRNFGL